MFCRVFNRRQRWVNGAEAGSAATPELWEDVPERPEHAEVPLGRRWPGLQPPPQDSVPTFSTISIQTVAGFVASTEGYNFWRRTSGPCSRHKEGPQGREGSVKWFIKCNIRGLRTSYVLEDPPCVHKDRPDVRLPKMGTFR